MEGEEDENEELPMSSMMIPIPPPEEGPRDSSATVCVACTNCTVRMHV